MSATYRFLGFLFGGLGVAAVFLLDPSDATYKPVTGIAVFAVLYVIAQSVERVVEWIVEGLKLIPRTPGNTKSEKVVELRQVNSTLNGNPPRGALEAVAQKKQDLESTVEDKRTDIMFLSHGLSILLCALAVVWMNYRFMSSLGATGLNADLDRLLTALAAAGGTKGLHELIGRVQAAKENAQTAAT